jgi:hypothetical protein
MEPESRIVSRSSAEAGEAAPREIRTCRVERWRGYVTSRFYVLSDDGAVLESKPFRWRKDAPPPESKKARAAYDDLVARLEAEGWSRLDQDRLWYATTFMQTVRMPVAPHQVPQVQPEPEPDDATASTVMEQIETESGSQPRRHRRSLLSPAAGHATSWPAD